MSIKSAMIVPCLMWGLCVLPASAQSNADRFAELIRAKDVEGQRALLSEWRRADASDPELYVAYFNHYVQESRTSVIRLDTEPGGQEMLEVLDPDTTVKEPVGYIYDDAIYDPALLSKAFTYIDTGITKFPQRLDMRFGKIYMHRENADHESFTREIIRTIDHGAATNYAWTWAGNEAVEDPKNHMYGNVQTYVYQLFEAGDDALFPYMIRIGEAVLKHEPKNVESLSTIGSVHVMQGDYDAGLELLLRAEKIDRKDAIVLGNIAQAYKRKGDIPKAIAYYERVVEVGDEEMKAFAREQIQLLKK